MSRFITIIMLVVISVSCGGGGSSDSADDSNPDSTTNPDTTSGDGSTPSISGFEFSLEEGVFWEFGWDTTVSSFAQGSGGSTSSSSGKFRLTLGPAMNVGGVSLYEILYSGNPAGWPESFTIPRWKYVGIDGSKVYGSVDGATLEVVFDAETGTWSGGGFFTEWPSSLIVAEPGSISNDYILDSNILRVGTSSSQSQCETIAGVTICGDESFTHTEYEYFKPGVGPVGYRYLNSFSSSGGGFSSGSSTERNLGLIGSSLAGDNLTHFLEHEPNNLVSNAMPIDLPATIEGQGRLEDDFGGVTPFVINSINEIEPNDSDPDAQVITLPVLIHGTVSANDLGTQTTSSPPGFTAYQTSIEDWYHWQNNPQELRFLLEYDASSGADLDLMIGGLNFFDTYSVSDNVGSGVYQEEAILNSGSQTSATYRVVVDAFSTPNGSVDYTLRVDTHAANGFANDINVADWFQITLNSSQSITISISGGSTVILATSAGDSIIEMGIPSVSGGAASITTSTLTAGDYLIGVSNTSTEYTLQVN